jgi:putative SOS response-associated peptidase YedK
MCGRYASSKSAVSLAEEFAATDATDGDDPGPDYNVAPTKPVLAVVRRHPRDADGRPDPDRTERSLRVLRWGLVPSWAKDASGAAKMINARAETAAEKPAYRRALAARRCLLPAEGWYEWKRADGSKQPYFVTGTDGASLAMAGLWEFRRSAEGESLVTCAVLTCDAVGAMAEIHHRMPVLLPPSAWDAWLDPDAPPAQGLLDPPSEGLVAGLELRPVSTAVNNVRNGGPGLTERVEVAEPALDLDLPAPSAPALW